MRNAWELFLKSPMPGVKAFTQRAGFAQHRKTNIKKKGWNSPKLSRCAYLASLSILCEHNLCGILTGVDIFLQTLFSALFIVKF